jgi:DNA-binding transcriptional LysR family regulator
MELRQLEYFVTVAEEANFTRAAQRVRISQSGVSAQIRQLERELGVVLFDRSARAVRLTAAGSAVLQHARAALSSAAAVQHAAGELAGVIRGRLTVGMVVGCTVSPLFEALAAFHAAHPGVAVALEEGNSERLVDQVREGDLDAALVGIAGSPPADLGSLVIVREGLSALVAPEHPFAAEDLISLRELAGEHLVCMPAGTGIRTVLDRACAAAGLRPKIALVASAADAIGELAGRGVGVGVLSTSMARDYQARHRDRTRVVDVGGVDVPAVLALLWPTTPNHAVAAFVQHAERCFGGAPTASAGNRMTGGLGVRPDSRA